MNPGQNRLPSRIPYLAFFAFFAISLVPVSAHAAYEAIGYHYKYITNGGGTYTPPTGVQDYGPYAGLSNPKEQQACTSLGYTRTDDQFETPQPDRLTWGVCYEYYDANGSIYDFDGAGQDKTLYYSKPIPALSASCSVTPSSIATGDSATWQATASGGIGTYTYSWSGTDGLSGSSASVIKSYSSAGTKTGTVSVTSGPRSATIACSNSLTVNATLPDLNAASVTPTSGTTDSAIIFSSTATNIGAGPSGSFPLLFQIQDGATFNSGYLSGLAPGASGSGSSGNIILSDPGVYQVRACANYNTSWMAITPESDYTNNCGPWTSVTVTTAPRADLTAGAVSPTSATAGQAVSLSATASNIGNATSGSFPMLFQVSQNGALRNSSYITGLAPNASGSGSASYTFPSAGTYQVRACANYNTSWTAITTESNYSNNCGPWTDITVAPEYVAPPTCTLSSAGASVPTTLTWNSSGATSCTGGGFSTGGATSGSASVTTAGAYTLSCSGPGGSCSASASVSASYCSGPAALSIAASPNRVRQGQSATISWNASNVPGANPYCTVSGPGISQTIPAGAVPTCSIPNGSATPTISTQSTYTITCGATSKSVTVNVVPEYVNY